MKKIFKSSFYEKLKLLIIPMMLLILGVGQMWANYRVTIYFSPKTSWISAGYNYKVNSRYDHTQDYWNRLDATNTGKTQNGQPVYSCEVDFWDGWNHVSTLQIQAFDSNGTQKEQVQLFNDTYDVDKSTYSGKWHDCNYDNNVWYTLSYDNIVSGGYIYFDNTAAQWSSSNYTQFVVGHASFYRPYIMTKLGDTHTKLYYLYLDGKDNHTWNDATYSGMFSANSEWPEASKAYSDIQTYAAINTGTLTVNYSNQIASGTSYLYQAASSSDEAALSRTILGGGYSDLNHRQTAYKYTSIDGGSTYSAASINSGTVTISAYKMTGNGTVSNTSNSSTINAAGTTSTYVDAVYTGEVTLSASAKTGYSFVGWFDAASGGSSVSSPYNAPNSTKSVYARFKANSYTISYNANGGTGTTSSSTHYYGVAKTLTSNGFTKDNYEFAGWTTNADGTGTSYTNGQSVTSLSSTQGATITLYAQWKQVLTLDDNGGSSDGSVTVYWNRSDISDFSEAVRTGYTCTGYYDGSGNKFIAEETGALVYSSAISSYISDAGKWVNTGAAPSLSAHWEANTYTVTLNDHDATIHGTSSTTATYGSAMPAITMPSKTGYTFGGYYTGENGTGTQYYTANGASARNWNIASNTTLHAYWIGITYDIAFNANEGSGSIDNQEHTYGSSLALTSNTTEITRSGYYFLGWNTNADGSGTDFYNGKTVSNLTTINGSIVTLYAQWAKTYTLYFVQAKCDWTNHYAKAEITFDGQTYYPLGGSNGTAMSNVDGGINLTHIVHNDSHNFELYKIDGVPQGSLVKFSNNGSSPTSNMSWTPDKPYYMWGSNTWYGLDGNGEISEATNMDVYLVNDETHYGIDQHGTEESAIIELAASTTYQFKYYNWMAGTWSGCTATKDDDAYILKSNTATGESEVWELNGSHNVLLSTTVAGEYKFKLTWNGGTPKAQLFFPVGVSLGALDVTQAPAGASTTVTLTATPAKPYLMTNPTYYYQMSTDNKNWTTIATSSSNSYAYTFDAQTCKFRVVLQNDAGLKSTSGTQSFTAYKTKSFYVYNPYNDDSNQWRWLHLYTWDSNNGNTTYNGAWPGGYIHCTDPKGTTGDECVNGNIIEAMGNNWFYITINATANCFMLVGESPYSDHQTVTCYVNNYIEGGKYMIFTESSQNKVVEYQAKGSSDFRLKYTDSRATRYSPIYNTTLDATTVTTSMWMNANDNTASLVLQQGSGEGTWNDAVTYSNSAKNGFGGLVDGDHRTHGYVFQMTLNTGTPAVSAVTEYAGSYYVRTDALSGGWNDYKKAEHTMHYSANSLSGSIAYDRYLCKWIGTASTNVKFTVANDYNPELVASLEGDVASTDPLYDRQTIPTTTNVRFSWNSQTNTLTRAYLSAATASSRFLVMTEKATGVGYTTGKIYDENGNALVDEHQVEGLEEHELAFEDLGNWVYQINMKANPGATAEVTATYNSRPQVFIPYTALIKGEGVSTYSYRIIYDFKTNMLTNAWVASDAVIRTEIDLNTNVMIIRNGQDAATQISFEDEGLIIEAKKLIGTMEFKYSDMVGKMSSWNSAAYQFCMYYISFPFDVNVSDIFGIGTYGVDWKLQYYDGEDRAARGFYEGDGTTTFWKDMPANDKMDAYVGYSLLLNRVKFNDSSSDIWENKTSSSSVFLYFPSTTDAGTIQTTTKTFNVPAHYCTKGAFADGSNKSHDITDSHWNMLGIPVFANNGTGGGTLEAKLTNPEESETTFRHLYEWRYTDNSLSVADGTSTSFTFEAMKSYMVQFHGPITFTGAGIVPASVAARKTAETRNYNIELQILNTEEQEINHTYVEMEDGASADFVLNEDLYMVTNKRAVNIYTFAGSYDVSANVLPVASTTVPVGVKVKTAGTYLFSMPSDFSGTVTLVDNVLNTRTNLALDNYAVYLENGTINDRFSLELNIQEATTSLENVDGNNVLNDGGSHKFIRNGQMYILRDGVIYDARGTRVK